MRDRVSLHIALTTAFLVVILTTVTANAADQPLVVPIWSGVAPGSEGITEKELIIEALEKTNWVKNKAANLLNLNRTTLVEKCKKLNI